ncbi:MAG: Mpo1-like protein, partial [Pseudomonadota bacterium]
MHGFFVEQMAMYSSYHRDHRNKLAHFIGVPAIAFSLFIPAALAGFFPVGFYAVSLATLIAAAVMVFWIVLDWPLGIATSLVFVPFVLLADWVSAMGVTVAWTAFAVLFAGGWMFQLVGHAFEGRKPALTDNLLQILIAPVFLVAEVVFGLGLRKSLHDEVDARWRDYLPKGAVP